MVNSSLRIIRNERITKDMVEMIMERPRGMEIRPGKFMDIKVEGFFLRRPISICDWNDEEITIVYRVVGRGTEKLGEMKAGDSLDVLLPLGNGFDTSAFEERPEGQDEDRQKAPLLPILIGGGAGVPPMLGLCRRLVEAGERPVVILGFRKTDEVFLLDRFEALDVDVIVATEDGSVGAKGLVTDIIKGPKCTNFFRGKEKIAFACGPEAMLRAVDEALAPEDRAQFSFEERMGCGFGACMGCSCRTKYGSKRICRDGPVLRREEIIW